MSLARLFSNRARPYDMGVLPTELLARDARELQPAGGTTLGEIVPIDRAAGLAAYAAAEPPLKAKARKER